MERRRRRRQRQAGPGEGATWLLAVVAVVQCLLLGVDGAGARSLPLGTTLPHVEIGAGETQLYEFEKTGDVPEGVETIVLRATREQVLRDEAEAVRLCFGVNATPADCAASGESFELWLEYNTLVENTTYVVGFYSSVALRYTMRSCISTCTQLCPNDCNGNGACVDGKCQCDATQMRVWTGTDCLVDEPLYLGMAPRAFAVFIIFAFIALTLLPGVWVSVCNLVAVDPTMPSSKRRRLPPERRPLLPTRQRPPAARP